jgi:membrane protein
LGSAVTALLFNLGKVLIAIYLGGSTAVSTYGAASSLVVIMLWVNYSAQIFLFGAEFTQVYTRRYGSLRPVQNGIEDPIEEILTAAQQLEPEPEKPASPILKNPEPQADPSKKIEPTKKPRRKTRAVWYLAGVPVAAGLGLALWHFFLRPPRSKS